MDFVIEASGMLRIARVRSATGPSVPILFFFLGTPTFSSISPNPHREDPKMCKPSRKKSLRFLRENFPKLNLKTFCDGRMFGPLVSDLPRSSEAQRASHAHLIGDACWRERRKNGSSLPLGKNLGKLVYPHEMLAKQCKYHTTVTTQHEK